jgi:hypothetical protein
MSARRHFSRMSALFESRATKERVRHLRERVQIGEMVFCKPEFIKSNYFQMLKKASAF